MKSNLLTSSRLRVARKCKREHRIRFELGYRPVTDADELLFGILLHLLLEAWWLAVQRGQLKIALDFALAALAKANADAFDKARAEAMVRGYDARWSDDAQHYEVLSVEQRFLTDVVNPDTGAKSKTWKLGGKLDVLLRDRRDGRVHFMEHKTSSEDLSPGSAYWAKLRMDGQVSIYFDGAASLGHDVAGALYDVLGKPGLKPSQVPVLDEHGNKVVLNAQGERVRTAQGKWRQTGDAVQGFVLQTRPETPGEYMLRCAEAICAAPDRYYGRTEVVRLESELAEARADIWSIAKELREDELNGRAPRNPDACERFGKLCAFFPICSGEASLDDPSRYRRVDDVHPELAEAEAPIASAG
jgi:hypothetical protein